MAKKLRVNTLYSIGAALRQPTPSEPKVFAATTSAKLLDILKKEKIQILSDKGQITCFNGLVLGIAKEQKLESVCILGEIDNPNIIQPKTVEVILLKLLELLKIKPLDMKDLQEEEKRKQFMEQQMNYMSGLGKKDNQPGIA